MKKIIILLCFFSLFSCNSQVKLENMRVEYFNIDKYKDWEVDTDFSQSADIKNLKKGNDRVEIIFDENDIRVKLKSTLNPYIILKVFSKYTKRLNTLIKHFGSILIEKVYEYDENGKIIRETNYDQLYTFTLKQVIEKIKREENIDLEDRKQRGGIERFVYSNNKPYYEVRLKTEKELTKKYIIIDGTTSESLFRTLYHMPDGDYNNQINPFDQYLESVKKKEVEDNTYKGKDYTKKEWEELEEEWYTNHQQNKGKCFWDDIFKRSQNK